MRTTFPQRYLLNYLNFTLCAFILLGQSLAFAQKHGTSSASWTGRSSSSDWSRGYNWSGSDPGNHSTRNFTFSGRRDRNTYNDLKGVTAKNISFSNNSGWGGQDFSLSGNRINWSGDISTSSVRWPYGSINDSIKLDVNMSAKHGAQKIDTGSGHNLSISGDISQSHGSNSYLSKNGNGTLTLSGNNSYRGGTLLNSGKLQVNSDNALGQSGLVMANSGHHGTSTLGLGKDVHLENSIRISDQGGLKRIEAFGGSNEISGNIQIEERGHNNFEISTGRNDQLTLSGNISSSKHATDINLTAKDYRGGGAIALQGKNSFSGDVNVGSDVTVIASGNSSLGNGDVNLLGTDSRLGLTNKTNLKNDINVSSKGGSKSIVGVGKNSHSTISGNIEINEAFPGTLLVETGHGQSIHVAGNVSGIGALTAVSKGHGQGGKVELSGDNNQWGGTVVSSGVEVVALSKNALGKSAILTGTNSTLSIGGVKTNPSVDLIVSNHGGQKILGVAQGFKNANFQGDIRIHEETAGNFDLLARKGQTLVVSGDISGPGESGITKSGQGTVVLTGGKNYIGPTTVMDGTLELAGDNSGVTGTIMINDGTSFTGTGIHGGSVVIDAGGIHSVGTSPGEQTIEVDLDYLSESIFEWELFSQTEAEADRGTQYDAVNVSGTLTIEDLVTSSLVFNTAGSSVSWADSFWDLTRQWLVFQNANPPSLESSTIFDTINVSTDSLGMSLSSLRPARFEWHQIGNDIFLRYFPTPEPNSIVLALLMFGLMMTVYLRSQAKSQVSESRLECE